MDIEDLRRRVENKRRKQEAQELLRELRGQNEPVDPGVIYLTKKDVAKNLGVCIETVQNYISNGLLKARKAPVGRTSAWVIHPKDWEEFKSYLMVKTAASGEEAES